MEPSELSDRLSEIDGRWTTFAAKMKGPTLDFDEAKLESVRAALRTLDDHVQDFATLLQDTETCGRDVRAFYQERISENSLRSRTVATSGSSILTRFALGARVSGAMIIGKGADLSRENKDLRHKLSQTSAALETRERTIKDVMRQLRAASRPGGQVPLASRAPSLAPAPEPISMRAEFDPDQMQAFWGGWSASAA